MRPFLQFQRQKNWMLLLITRQKMTKPNTVHRESKKKQEPNFCSYVCHNNIGGFSKFSQWYTQQKMCNKAIAILKYICLIMSTNVREYVFTFFSKSKKTWLFTCFWSVVSKKTQKRRKPYPSFMYTNQITGVRRLLC